METFYEYQSVVRFTFSGFKSPTEKNSQSHKILHKAIPFDGNIWQFQNVV